MDDSSPSTHSKRAESRISWRLIFAVGGVSYLVLVWIFRTTELDAGIYGLLFLACAGILVLSVIKPAYALLAGIFATPLITIQYQLPIMGQILSFDKFLVVSFPLVWLVRCIFKGPPRQLGQCRNVVIAWGLTLIAITSSAVIAWTGNEFNQFHVKTFLEPLLIAFFFFASYDVLAHEPSFAPKLVQALLISASLVLLGSSIQLIFELVGTSPPRLVLMADEKSFPFLARFSTLAHPNYIGAFVAFASALALGHMTNHRHDLKFIPFWIIAGGALIVFFAKSLAGLFLFSAAISVGVMMGLSTNFGTKRSNGYIYRTAILGIVIVSGSAIIWGLPKIRKAVSFSIRAYPYKVVSSGIWSHPFFGNGPGSYPKVFQQLEKKVPPKERPISRRPITKAMLRKFIRPMKNGVTLEPDESPIWLGYEIKNPKRSGPDISRRSLLEGVVLRARIRADKPNTGRLYLQQRGSIRESVFNSKAESQVLFVSTPLRLRGVPRWKVVSHTPGQRVEWASGLDPTQQNGLKILKTPFEMRFDLKHILKSTTADKNLERREIAVGAWVKSSAQTRKGIFVELLYERSTDPGERKIIQSNFYSGDGRWQFLTIRTKIGPIQNLDRLWLTFNSEKQEEGPVSLGGIFFDDGNELVNLIPGNQKVPKSDMLAWLAEWKQSSPLPSQGYSPPGWRVLQKDSSSFVKKSVGRNGKSQTAILIQDAPFEMKTEIKSLLQLSKNTQLGPGISMGAWVKSGSPGRLALKHKFRLRLFDGNRNFYSDFHPGDGHWHFLKAHINGFSSSNDLTLILEVGEEGLPLGVDGVFFKSGKRAINLLPGDQAIPPPSFTNEKEIKILSLSEYLNGIKSYWFANKEPKKVGALDKYLSPSQISMPTENSPATFDIGELTFGVVAEPGHGPVHFDNLELESPKGKILLTKIWKSLQSKINHPHKSGELISSPWSLRIEGWSNQVPPTLSAHSTFLAIAVELGLLGLLCFLFLYGAAIWEVAKRNDISSRWNLYIATAMGVLFLSSMVEDTFLILRFSVLFWALAAAGLIGVGENRGNASSR